jgi:hypothetical protein
LELVCPVDKSGVYYELSSLTLAQIQNIVPDNLPTFLHPDQRQRYFVFDSFLSVLDDEIHIFLLVFSEFQGLEI